jgi:NADPH:quinone reductase-like Zn-dependent oxidoreductase
MEELKALVFYSGIEIRDLIEPPVSRDEVFIRPKKVALNGIENGVFFGLIWVQPLRVLGTFGCGIIEKTGVDVDKRLQGKRVAVLGISSKGVIGTDIDGLIAQYTSIPEDAIVEIPNNLSDEDASLVGIASISEFISNKAEGRKLLVIGSGPIAISTIIVSQDKANRVSQVTLSEKTRKTLPNIEVITRVGREWDVVVISSGNAYARIIARKAVKRGGEIIVVPTSLSYTNAYQASEEYKLTIARPSKEYNTRTLSLIRKYIEIESVNSLEYILPIRKPLVILDVEKALGDKG